MNLSSGLQHESAVDGIVFYFLKDLVGDIHQPLHVAALYYDKDCHDVVDPNVVGAGMPNFGIGTSVSETTGGNDLTKGSNNLHHYWDDNFVDKAMKSVGFTENVGADATYELKLVPAALVTGIGILLLSNLAKTPDTTPVAAPVETAINAEAVFKITPREPDEARKNFDEMLALYSQGKLKPHISMRFPLEKGADAMNALLSRKATGKVVLTVA
jgi:NADPH:quinone reductase-like Zn-dependent oxidoreductase